MVDEAATETVVETPVEPAAATVGAAVETPVAPAAAPAPAVEGKWPEGWRTEFAGGDEAKASRFERYTDPAAVGQAFLSAQDKISSGELAKSLPASTHGLSFGWPVAM